MTMPQLIMNVSPRNPKVEQMASMSSLFDNISWDLDFVSSLTCPSTNETIQSFEQCFRIKTNCKSLNFVIWNISQSPAILLSNSIVQCSCLQWMHWEQQFQYVELRGSKNWLINWLFDWIRHNLVPFWALLAKVAKVW